MAKALSNPKADRVIYDNKYCGNSVGGFFKLGRTQPGYSDDYIWFLIDEFSRQYPKPFGIFGRKPMVQMNVFSFYITEIVERDKKFSFRSAPPTWVYPPLKRIRLIRRCYCVMFRF